jgi:GTPase
MFLDRAVIRISAGDGGKGCIAFRREKYVPKGGPNGGDGGDGADVYFFVDPRQGTLRDFRYKRHFRAPKGEAGQGSDKTGASGETLRIGVPAGTTLYNHDTGELLGDLTRDGQEVLVARGGQGGRGNARFKTSTNQAPRRADDGMPGEELSVRLELRLIADVGLVGFPNAGKSTLLSRISAARPKIADYPFTTLTPNLGVVELGEYRSLVVADIPGLLEGAHEGKGLGLEFLRHIERTRVLVFLLDLSTEDPAADLATLRNELKEFGHGLPQREHIVALNKADLFPKAEVPDALSGEPGVRVISAVRGDGVDQLLEDAWKLVRASADAEAAEGGDGWTARE